MDRTFEIYILDKDGNDFSKIVNTTDAREALIRVLMECKDVVDLSNLMHIESNIC